MAELRLPTALDRLFIFPLPDVQLFPPALLPTGGDMLRAISRQESDVGATVDLVAAALVTESAQRQELLEQLDVAARLDQLVGAVARLVTHFQPGTSSSGNN